MSLDFPSIYLLPMGFEKNPHGLHELERKIGVVWNIKEAELVLGKLSKKTRAVHELKQRNLFTVDLNPTDGNYEDGGEPKQKRRKVDAKAKQVIALDSDTESGSDDEASPKPLVKKGTIKVLNLAWYTSSLEAGELLPVEKYLVYEGRIVDAPKTALVEGKSLGPPSSLGNFNNHQDDTQSGQKRAFDNHHHRSRTHGGSQSQLPLLQEMTEDHDAVFPPIPEYLHTIYSCQRPTPLHCPNEAFVAQLRIMKKGRMLEDEGMRARAYNGAIATIACYPYTITSAYEVKRLPNCGDKIARVWLDWHEDDHIQEALDFLNDQKFQTLSLFYDIHDVGQKTALEFWKKGYRDLDDLVVHEWEKLTRGQQIGVKFCEEFQQRIPRPEVEKIANKVLEYANLIHPGFQMVICGGYRRGKETSGDVDVILSHPDEDCTAFVLEKILEDLEDPDEAGYITHRLEYGFTNSNRNQAPLLAKGGTAKKRSGFDTLDHAFVVWQEPTWDTMEEDLQNDPNAKNTNLHRRLDIIISPWKTAGCAVLGWTGGTMFERDLRAYCRKEKGWKFDSSGIRDLATEVWIDLEKGAETLLEKERKVFEGLGLEWREPTERCTD